MKTDWTTKTASLILILLFLAPDLIASVNALNHFPSNDQPIMRSTVIDASVKKVEKKESEDGREWNTAGKTPDGRKKVKTESYSQVEFLSTRTETFLGNHPGNLSQNPADYIFTIEVSRDINEYEYKYLRYKIKGLEDGKLIPKSINGKPVYAGKPLAKGAEWQEVTFAIHHSDMKLGLNQVRFALPNNAFLPVTIKDVGFVLSKEEIPAAEMPKVERKLADPIDFDILGEETEKVGKYAVTDIDMPTIPNNIVNVTRNNWGYLTSDNDSNYRISIGVATSRLLPGKSLSDVKLFYFDEESVSWKMALVDNVMPEENNVEGAVPGGTNYFAGLIKSPEMPEASAFLPTVISDIKAANPAEGMNIMQPPSVSRTGEASIRYPLDIPAGRQGMQPDLALTYSSDKGTGSLGVGWDIPVSMISIDTRWGVPTFPENTQEEVYLLNGSPLTEQNGKKGNRNPGTRGTSTVMFFERTMGAYKTIERKGSSPETYVWTVTTADGTKYYYGTLDGTSVNSNAVLRDGANEEGDNIIRWYLRKVEDKWGNWMNYNYIHEQRDAPGNVKDDAWAVSLSGMNYTRYGSSTGKYSIGFDYTDERPDATVSLKSGAKEVDDRLLDKIRVMYNGGSQTEVKYFKFHYTNNQGTFFKTVLDSVAEYRGGAHFYSHSFEYHKGALSYGNMEQIEVDHFGNRLSEGANPAIATVAGAVENLISPSPIKTTVTTGWGAGGALGLGVAVGPVPLPDKTFTFSGRLGYSETSSRDKISLDDYNGDGLPDLVYDRGSGPKYYPLQMDGTGDLSFSNHYSKINTKRLMKSKSSSLSYGFDFGMPLSIYYYGKNWSEGESTTSLYMTDYNADGIKDLVNGNSVVFGKLEPYGDITFSGSSEATFSPVKKGVTVAEPQDNEEYKDMEIVRSWEAPFYGFVNINGIARVNGSLNAEVEVAMQHNSDFTTYGQWQDISSTNPAVNMAEEGIEVFKGDKLLFRIRSGEDGQQDLVNWVPEVEYVDLDEWYGVDGNGLNYGRSNYEEGFLLSGGGGVTFEGGDAIQVSWPSFEVGGMSDDVVLRVNLTVVEQNSGEVERQETYEYVVPAGSDDNPVPSDFKLVGESSAPDFMTSMSQVPDANEDHSCHLSFEIWSTSNVIWKKINWRPEVSMGEQPCAAVDRIAYPVVYYNTYNRVQKIGLPYQDGITGSSGEMIRVWPQEFGLSGGDWLQIFSDEELAHPKDISYTAYVVSKAGGSLLSKMAMVFHNDQSITFHEVSPNGSLGAAITLDDPNSDYWFDEGLLMDFGNMLHVEIFTHKRGLSEVLFNHLKEVEFYYAGTSNLITGTENFNIFHEDRTALQDYYLHWGQFCWSDKTVNPIDTGDLHLATEEFANDESNDYSGGEPPGKGELDGMDENLHNPMSQKFFMLIPQRGEETAGLREYIKEYEGGTVQSLDRWSAWGLHIGAYPSNGATAPGKFGEPEVEPVTSSSSTPGNYGAYATSQSSKSYTLAKSEGVGPYVDSRTVNDVNNYFSQSLSMFMDMNGDGFPDIVRNNGVLETSLTSPTGGHRGEVTFDSNPLLSKSTTNNVALPLAGIFVNADLRFAKVSGSGGIGSNNSITEWVDLNGDGLVDKASFNSSNFALQLNSGKGLMSPVNISNASLSKSSNFTAGLGFSVPLDNLSSRLGMSFSGGAGLNVTGDKSEKLLMDFTGDGLPDLVTINAAGTPSIFINTGTSYEPVSPGGLDFSSVESYNKAQALGISGSSAASIAISLGSVLFFNFKMSISGNGQINYAVNELKSSFKDMNGDGVLDYVQTNAAGNLEVYFAQVEKQNLLKKVTNPIKGSFTIDYEKVGNKYGNYPVQVKTHNTTADELMVWDMPEGKWVMSKLTVHDGLELTDPSSNNIDGEDEIEYLFNYDGGIKSRREREFLGFTRTETVQPANIPEPVLNSTNKIYMSQVTEYTRPTSLAPMYRRRLEYMKGLVTDQYTLHIIEKRTQEQGEPPGPVIDSLFIKLMEHRINDYEYRYVEIGEGGEYFNRVRKTGDDWDIVNWNNVDEVSCIFPALKSTETITVPQTESPDNYHAVKYELEYDTYTNVTEFRNEGIFTEGNKTTHVVGSVNNDHYDYIIQTYPLSHLTSGLAPFNIASYEDPVSGDKCYVVACADASYSSDTICASGLYFNDPCNIVPPPGDHDSITTVHRKLIEEDVDITEEVYTPVYEGPILARMTYFSPTQTPGITNELQTHKIYLGSTANDPERHTEVSTLYQSKAPKVIWNYLNSSDKAITSLDYDNYGNVTSITAPKNGQNQNLATTFTYDTDLNQYVVGVSNSYGDAVCMKYDPATGNLLKKEDINGRPVQYEYDTFYRLKEVWGPNVAENINAAPTISFSYHPKGINPTGSAMEKVPVAITNHAVNGPIGTRQCAPPCTTTTLSCTNLMNVSNHPPMDNPLQTATFMDGLQRVVQVKKDASKHNSSYNDNIRVHTISGITAYDRLGRQTGLSLSRQEADSNPIGRLNNTKSTVIVHATTLYDYANRPLYETDIVKGPTRYAYAWNDDGEYYTRELSSVIIRNYTDAWKRTYKIEQGTSDMLWVGDGFAQGTPTYDTAVTTFEYDALNQLVESKNPEEQITSYTYDRFGRMKTEVHPDKGTATFTYDLAGNLTKLETPATGTTGILMEYEYNRLKEKTYPNSPEVNNVVYTYGSLNDGKNGAGRVVQVVQGEDYITENYKYDEYGNRNYEQKIIQVPQVGQRTFNTFFTYDAWGRIGSITYPDNEKAVYEYTEAGELERVRRFRVGVGLDNIIDGIYYDGFGNIKKIKYANGVATDLGYDTETRQLTDVDIFNSTQTLLNKTIDYDGYGNVESIVNTQPSVNGLGGTYTMNYQYDAMNQLLSAQGSGNFNGVTHNYNLAMNYNLAGGIVAKNQRLTGGAGSTYKINYTYKGSKKHQLDNFQYYGSMNSNEVEYNTSGSVMGIYYENHIPGGGTNKVYQEKFQWDEDQKMMGAENLHGIYHYLYDHNGERIMKSALMRTGVALGGSSQNSYEVDPYTVYVNPYYIATHYQQHVETSKHFYMGSQRIAASLKGATFTQQSPAAAATDGAFENLINVLEGFGKTEGVDFQSTSLLQKRSIVEYDSSPDYQNATIGCAEPEPQCECEHSRYWPANCNTADIIYWYHPDYLGNTEFITDRNGDPYQFFWYSPWGESLKDQHKYDGEGSNFYDAPFRFNAKEFDEETGLYYYGARYYNPQTSVWLSVDPMSSARPGLTPYNFVSNNPVMRIDPTGMLDETYEIDKQGNTQKVDNTKYYQEQDGSVTTVAEGGTYEGSGTEVDRVQSQSDPSKGIYTSKSTMDGKVTRDVPGIGETDMYSISDEGEAKEFFEFAAQVSDVEWDNTNYNTGNSEAGGTNNLITTSHKGDRSGGLGFLDQNGATINYSNHSHPRHGRIHGGDGNAIRNLLPKNQDAIFKVFYPGTGKYQSYDKWVR